MRNRFLLGAAGIALAMGLIPGQASAQLFAMPSGPGTFYVGGEGGWTWLQNQNLQFPSRNVGRFQLQNTTLTQKFDGGPVVGLRGGYELGPWQLEEEFAYRINGISELKGANFAIPLVNFPSSGVNGNRVSYAFMTNLLYNFDLGFVTLPVTPHIGAGVGAVLQRDAWSLNNLGTIAANNQWSFGYQAIGGVRYNINPALAFDVDYKYFATVDTTFHTAPALGATNYKTGNNSHNVLASFVVKFG